MVKFTIRTDPKTKKNSMQPRISPDKRFLGMMQSDIYKQYEKDCGYLIPHEARQGITKRINVAAVFYRKTRRTVDLSNLISALHDVMVKYGVIRDDNCTIIAGTDGSRVDYDKDNPRTEVAIMDMEAWDAVFQKAIAEFEKGDAHELV